MIKDIQTKFLIEQVPEPGDKNFEKPKKSSKHSEYDEFLGEKPKLPVDMRGFSLDPHTSLTIIQISTAFIPLIGPLLSLGVGLYDAKLYYDEGDKKTAGLVGMFSLIPGMGGIASKIGLSKWTSKSLSLIGKKISMGTKLTSTELEVVNRIAKNKNLILSEMKKIGEDATIRIGKQSVKKKLKKQGLKQSLKSFGKQTLGYGGVGVGYSKAYDFSKKDNPKIKIESQGFDWDLTKNSFGSSGSEEDNKLLTLAFDNGWRPGKIVPKEFRTKLYNKLYNIELQNLKKLNQLLSQNN